MKALFQLQSCLVSKTLNYRVNDAGFVVEDVMERMRSLRKGETQVKEWGHTVLCGWGSHSIAFIHQICLANASGHSVLFLLSYLMTFNRFDDISPNET